MITAQVVLMARPIILSNGELHIGLNTFGLVHDFYYPYVGLENHSAGENLRHKIGIWIDGSVSWLDEDSNWSFEFRYPHEALIGLTIATNKTLGIVLELEDCIATDVSVFLRNIHIINLLPTERDIRLFMHQAFAIGDSRSHTDTAQYLPNSDAILHYRGHRAFVISGQYNNQPFDQHSIGLFGIEGHEGTYKDADDGELSNSVVEHGKVDSVLRFMVHLDAQGSQRVHYWIAAGESTRDALSVHKQVKDDGLVAHMQATAAWWKTWLEPAQSYAAKLPSQQKELFIESIMVLKSQMDNHGAVIASTDTSMLNYSRDTYAYCWPRDGANVIWPLVRMGYTTEPRKFFEFCLRGLHPGGYLMHKYRADGALGSSWHPYVHADGSVSAPIQEDETALVLYVFGEFYQAHKDPEILKQFYKTMVVPMADFLADFIDEGSGLPKPSYDLWEEIYATSTYTVAVTYAALLAASDLATASNDAENAVRWRSAANDIQYAAHKHLYNFERKSLYKNASVKDGLLVKDPTIDASSIFGAYLFGLFAVDSEELTNAVESLKQAFNVTSNTTGLPRYEDDNYRREDGTGVGNWWYITTLWLAQYYIGTGKIDDAMESIDWITSMKMDTGMMAEQINPTSREQISPAPLTWSHAEYVSTMLDTITEPR